MYCIVLLVHLVDFTYTRMNTPFTHVISNIQFRCTIAQIVIHVDFFFYNMRLHDDFSH
jgi:hypothetical protein